MGIEEKIGALSGRLKSSERMPAIFVGHGNPMYAIQENTFTDGFKTMSKQIAPPQAILCVSAHWYTDGSWVTGMEQPRTIHDFGGFPRELYEVEYAAEGNPALAAETRRLLEPEMVGTDAEWGLDHGCWAVLRHLYPEAEVPVVQLSIDRRKPAAYHFEMAKKLRSLREKGVLVVGSGNIVHNLRMVDWLNMDKVDHGYDWAAEAREVVNGLMHKGDFDALADYGRLPQAVQLAVPTPDHFLPLLYVLALHEKDEDLSLFNDRLVGGSLSMTSVKIGE